jgi:hypothetical protein
MSDASYGDGSGRIVTLRELRAKFKLISHGEHQWSAQLVLYSGAPDIGWPSLCVHVWYSNPELVDMPNQICFRFPAFHQALGYEEDTLVCLHPSLADLIVHGFYPEEDKLMRDCLEDFNRFWTPLSEVL